MTKKAKLALSAGWAGCDLTPSCFLCWHKQVDSLSQWLAGHVSLECPSLPNSCTESSALLSDVRCLMGELTWGGKGSFPQDSFQIPGPNQSELFWQVNKIIKADLQCITRISHTAISYRVKENAILSRNYFPLIISEIIFVLFKERQRSHKKIKKNVKSTTF